LNTDNRQLETTQVESVENTDNRQLETTQDESVENTDNRQLDTTQDDTVLNTDNRQLETTQDESVENTDNRQLETTQDEPVLNTDNRHRDTTQDNLSKLKEDVLDYEDIDDYILFSRNQYYNTLLEDEDYIIYDSIYVNNKKQANNDKVLNMECDLHVTDDYECINVIYPKDMNIFTIMNDTIASPENTERQNIIIEDNKETNDSPKKITCYEKFCGLFGGKSK
jgi:hypothetical protein